MDAIMTARMVDDIAAVVTEVRSNLSSVLMEVVFILRIALLPGQPVQHLFALASRDTRGT